MVNWERNPGIPKRRWSDNITELCGWCSPHEASKVTSKSELHDKWRLTVLLVSTASTGHIASEIATARAEKLHVGLAIKSNSFSVKLRSRTQLYSKPQECKQSNYIKTPPELGRAPNECSLRAEIVYLLTTINDYYVPPHMSSNITIFLPILCVTESKFIDTRHQSD